MTRSAHVHIFMGYLKEIEGPDECMNLCDGHHKYFVDTSLIHPIHQYPS